MTISDRKISISLGSSQPSSRVYIVEMFMLGCAYGFVKRTDIQRRDASQASACSMCIYNNERRNKTRNQSVGTPVSHRYSTGGQRVAAVPLQTMPTDRRHLYRGAQILKM